MQIDKSACNKPLTLNCEVTANPAANITWYRRRLNRVYVEHLRAAYEHDRRRTARLLASVDPLTEASHSAASSSSSSSSASSSSSSSSARRSSSSQVKSILRESLVEIIEHTSSGGGDLAMNGDLYEDEMVGTGPTYTIASFNCANLVRSLPTVHRNSTASDDYGGRRRFRRQRDTTLPTTTTSTTTASDDDDEAAAHSQETLYADSVEMTTDNPGSPSDAEGSIQLFILNFDHFI